MRFAVYSRKSKATSKGDSIGNQIEMIRNYINGNFPSDEDHTLTVFEDDGFSAKSIKRPAFLDMLAHIKNKEFDFLIVYRLDRISRNIRDFSEILEILEKCSTQFISINERFDTSTPLGRAMMYISSVFAQMERETISERVSDNMLELSKTGIWLGGRTPFGFDSKRVAGSATGIKKDHSILVENPETIGYVKQLYDAYLQLGSITKVIKWAYANGIRSNTGSKITDFILKSILQNPVYTVADEKIYDYFFERGATLPENKSLFDGTRGIIAYNRHKTTSSGISSRPMSEWVIAPSIHEPVIDSDTWLKVQKRIGVMSAEHPRNYAARNDYALLTGLLYCKLCGGKMYSQPQNSGRGKKRDSGAFTYICETRKSLGVAACSCKSVSGKRLDEYVMLELSKYEDESSPLLGQLSRLKVAKASKKDMTSDILRTKGEIFTGEKKMGTLIDRMADPDISPEVLSYVKRQCEQLASEIRALRQSLQDAEASVQDKNATIAGYEYVKNVLYTLATDSSTMTIPQKRDLITSIVRKVEWDGDNASVFIYDE